MPVTPRYNDFVVKFANVNGSGSASANGLFAKGVMRMGVPVAARNIFPSNIQGLPTWYEVRITEEGHLGRRGGVDLMVAMNPQTWDKDVAEIESGGFLFYDSTKPMPASAFREDIGVIGVPLTAMCNAAYQVPRERQLFKNIIYVGALCALLGMEPEVFETLFAEQFKGRQRLIDANIAALRMGVDYVREHLQPLPLQVRRADRVGDRIYVEGNEAAALGAVYGDRLRLVSHHALHQPGGSLHQILPAAARRPRDRQGALRHRPGRGRNRLHRHGRRRRLERCAGLHLHFGPGHLADDRVRRPLLLRRDPSGDLRRPARRPLDRHADPDAAGRPAGRGLFQPRGHQASATVPRRSRRVLHHGGPGLRPRRPAADHGLRHARPRHRHE
jgi:Pyruvate/2-oxoacid:ferredoxin oxidoreductase gamma subunit